MDLDKDYAAIRMRYIDEFNVGQQGGDGMQNKDAIATLDYGDEAAEMPKQLTFEFAAAFDQVVLDDLIRGIRTIAKEVARMGGDSDTMEEILRSLARDNDLIIDAVKEMKR